MPWNTELLEGQAGPSGSLRSRVAEPSRTPMSTTRPAQDGADLRYVKDQMGHASIEETEGTHGHLEVERHEQRVDLDHVLIGPAAH